MEIELYSKTQLDLTQPKTLEELRALRIVEPYRESPDYEARIIPGDRRDLMALPGQCLSGKYDDAWYIDLQVDTDNGAAYIGATMFHHLANLVGYTQADAHRRALKRIEELEAENAKLRNHVRRLRQLRADLGEL